MVLPLKVAKFYGSSLPRPRIYTDVKLSDERVDPPVPVLDPLMSWASDAHWSMGGLSFNRLRLQGKIEGNVNKLRKERETSLKMKIHNSSPLTQSKKKGGNRVDSPPPAPISKKRKQRITMEDEIEIEQIKKVKKNGGLRMKRRRLVRKLGDDFELVGSENERSPLKDVSNGDGVALRTRSRRSMVVMDEEEEGGKKSKHNKDVSPNGSRSSPRLKQRLDYFS